MDPPLEMKPLPNWPIQLKTPWSYRGWAGLESAREDAQEFPRMLMDSALSWVKSTQMNEAMRGTLEYGCVIDGSV